MHGAEAAENSVIADRDVTGKRRVVNEDHTIADLTVMGDMGAHHQQAISADAGHEAAGLGAWIDGDMLADDRARPDLEAARLALIFLVLRNMADRGEGKNLAPLADRAAAGHHHMRMQHGAVANPDLRPHNAER